LSGAPPALFVCGTAGLMAMPRASTIDRIDPERLRELWLAGWSSPDIGVEFNCSYSAVSVMARRMGLPPRSKSALRRKPAPQLVAAPVRAPAAPLSPLEADVKQSGGRWAALAAVAVAHGVTATKAQQVWHLVRR